MNRVTRNFVVLSCVVLSYYQVSPHDMSKCCPSEYSIDEDYGYKDPAQFTVGNLHCRPDPEADLGAWIPRYFRMGLEQIEVPDLPSSSELLATCAGYELATHNVGAEAEVNVSDSGNITFFTGGVEGTEQVDLEGGSYCVDTHFHEHGSVVIMSCSCPSGNCVPVCCTDYAQVGYLESHSLTCRDSGLAYDNWTLANARAQISPVSRWVPRSSSSLRRRCQYASLEFQPGENLQPYPLYVLKHREIMKSVNFVIDEHLATLHVNGLSVKSEHYCVSPTLNENGELVTAAFFCDSKSFVASPRDVVVQSWLAGVGGVFTFLTIVGLATSPSMRKGPEGISLLAHCMCMLAAYTALTVRPYVWSVEGEQCLRLAIVLQFLFLAAFFWLNVRAVTIFARFRSLETMLSRLSGTHKGARWFLPVSMLYAFGVPALLCGITAAAQEYSRREPRLIWRSQLELLLDDDMGGDMKPSWLVTPDLDDTTCWFGTAIGRTLYFTLPMGLVLLVNLWMFVSTVTRLAALTARKTGSFSTADMRSDKRRLLLFGKMFIVMGLGWSGELLAFANYLSHYYWYLSSAAMTLRAAAVFFMFCCRKEVWQELRSSCCSNKESEKEATDGDITAITKTPETSRSTTQLQRY